MLVVSQVIWDKLSEEERGWLQQAADESVVLQRKLWAESEIESLKVVEAAGVEIIYPDKQPFIDKVQPLLESYNDNEVIYSYIKRIQAVE